MKYKTLKRILPAALAVSMLVPQSVLAAPKTAEAVEELEIEEEIVEGEAPVEEVETGAAEQPETENPTMARTAKSRPSEPSSGSRSPRGDVGVSEREASRPSVREELREIRREQRQKSPETDRERVHIPARIKKDEEVSL